MSRSRACAVRVCFNVCPVRGKAILSTTSTMTEVENMLLFIPVVHSEKCTGCGKCEKACILEEAAIKVFPCWAGKRHARSSLPARLGAEEGRRPSLGHARFSAPLPICPKACSTNTAGAA